MNIAEKLKTINTELIRIAKSRRIGTPRFRFPIPVDDAYQLIGAYYTAEVERRGLYCEYDSFTLDKILQLAEIITAERPKIGVLLTGTVGNGKTTLMRAFNGAARQLVDWNKITPSDYGFQHAADFGLEIHTTKAIVNYSINDPQKYERIAGLPMLGLDELGEEPKNIQNYGNATRPIVELIERRYNEQKFTFITSNLDPQEIVEHYGERVGDRFREMLHVIQYRNHPSFRK